MVQLTIVFLATVLYEGGGVVWGGEYALQARDSSNHEIIGDLEPDHNGELNFFRYRVIVTSSYCYLASGVPDLSQSNGKLSSMHTIENNSQKNK